MGFLSLGFLVCSPLMVPRASLLGGCGRVNLRLIREERGEERERDRGREGNFEVCKMRISYNLALFSGRLVFNLFWVESGFEL